MVLFKGAIRWAKHQVETYCVRSSLALKCSAFSNHEEVSPSKVREALGEALYLVRFPLMDGKAFAVGPAESGILTAEV